MEGVSQHFCAFSENLSVVLLVQRLSSVKGVGNVMLSGISCVLHAFVRFLRLLRAFYRSISVRFHCFQRTVLIACSSAQNVREYAKKEVPFEQTAKKGYDFALYFFFWRRLKVQDIYVFTSHDLETWIT